MSHHIKSAPAMGAKVSDTLLSRKTCTLRVLSGVSPAAYVGFHDAVVNLRDRGLKEPTVHLACAGVASGRIGIRLGLHTSWGGGQFRHPDFPKSLGNRENPRFFIVFHGFSISMKNHGFSGFPK